jgi:hypothetical protein
MQLLFGANAIPEVKFWHENWNLTRTCMKISSSEVSERRKTEHSKSLFAMFMYYSSDVPPQDIKKLPRNLLFEEDRNSKQQV